MPLIPSEKPGKFSTSEVVVSYPPGATPFAIQPSKRIGFNSARDAYMVAVWAAGPLPMMHTFVLRVWRSSTAGVEELVAVEEDALLGVEVEVATTTAEVEANRTNFNLLLNKFKSLFFRQ